MVNPSVSQPNNLHGQTVPGLLYRQAQKHPFKLALSARSYQGYRDRLSYAQLVIRMDSMARALLSRGVKTGDRVALLLSNDAMREAVLTAIGCYRMGAIVVPVNTRGADDELRYAFDLVNPKFVVVTPENSDRVRRTYPQARLLLLNNALYSEDSWPDPEREFHDLSLPAPGSPEDTTVLLFTSGTTARAKAVMHCHRSQLYCGYAVGTAMGLTDQDTYQGAWPIFTSSVLNMACMASWVTGAGAVLEEATLDNSGRLRLIETEGTSVYHGVTSPLNFMIDEYVRGKYDLSRVRRIGYGGAAMPAEVIDKFTTRLPWADQIHIWGMTETGPSGTFLPPWFLPRKAGCIGGPMPGCSVRVIDEQGQPLPTGETGEIVFSGPSMAHGYFRNPQATADAFVNGWVHTGDIGRFDDEGHLHFVDRKKDIINRGGLKIASAAVEEVIYRHPKVQETAVVSIPHAGLGEDLAGCVVARPGETIDPEDLRQHCAKHLADYEVPRRWFVLDALPKNPMGKILKRELRATLLESINQEHQTK